MILTTNFLYKLNLDLIFDYMKKNNVFIPEFCEKCDITLAEFGDILKENPATNDETLRKISNILKVDFIDLFK